MAEISVEEREKTILELKNIDKKIQKLKKCIKKDISKLEKIRGSKVILFLVGDFTEIDREIVSDIYNENKNLLKRRVKKLDVIVDSSGGQIDAAVHLVNLFRKMTSGELTFMVPRWAKSAATCLVCGGDKLIMGETSEIGPVDPQIKINKQKDSSRFSPLSIEITLDLLGKLIKEGNEKLVDKLIKNIETFSLGEFLRTLEVSPNYMYKILKGRMLKNKEKEEIKNIAKVLGRGYPHHGYCILMDDAIELGLNVLKPKQKEWDLIWGIWINYDKIRNLSFYKTGLMNDYKIKKKS